MAIRKYEREEVLIFITNMKKTGQNVLKALIHYANYMAKRQELKNAVDDIVMKIKRGSDIEDALLESRFLNQFQYAILKNSKNKNEAYDKILKYNNSKSKADKFYFKKWTLTLLSLIAMSFVLPSINGVVAEMINNVKNINDEFVANGIITFFLNNNDLFFPLGIALTGLFFGGLVFYFYTYKYDLNIHYKTFKLKAMSDSLMYFEIINDMLKSGLKTFTIFELLSKYMHPNSSREIFEKIHEDLKNNQSYIEEFKKLGVNDFTIFTLKTAQEIGDIKGGFKNALISITDYKKKKEEFYLEVVDALSFLLITAPFSLILWYLTVATIDVANI